MLATRQLGAEAKTEKGDFSGEEIFRREQFQPGCNKNDLKTARAPWYLKGGKRGYCWEK